MTVSYLDSRGAALNTVGTVALGTALTPRLLTLSPSSSTSSNSGNVIAPAATQIPLSPSSSTSSETFHVQSSGAIPINPSVSTELNNGIIKSPASSTLGASFSVSSDSFVLRIKMILALNTSVSTMTDTVPGFTTEWIPPSPATIAYQVHWGIGVTPGSGGMTMAFAGAAFSEQEMFDVIAAAKNIQPIPALIAHTGVGSPDGLNATTPAIDTTGATLLVVGVTYYGPGYLIDSKGNVWTALAPSVSGFTSATNEINSQLGSAASSELGIMQLGSLPPYRDTSSPITVQLFYCSTGNGPNGGPIVGPGHTFSFINGGGSQSLQTIEVVAFSGTLMGSALDISEGAVIEAQMGYTGELIPNYSNEVIVATASLDAIPPSTIDSGFIITDEEGYVGGEHFGGILAYLIQSARNIVNPRWATQNYIYSTAIASFKAAEPVANSDWNFAICDNAIKESLDAYIAHTQNAEDPIRVTKAAFQTQRMQINGSSSTSTSLDTAEVGIYHWLNPNSSNSSNSIALTAGLLTSGEGATKRSMGTTMQGTVVSST